MLRRRPTLKFSLRSLCILLALASITLVVGTKWHHHYNSRPIQTAVDEYNRKNRDPRLSLTANEVVESLSNWKNQTNVNHSHARKFSSILSSKRVPNDVEFSVVSSVVNGQHILFLGVCVIGEHSYTIRSIDNGKWPGFATRQTRLPDTEPLG